MTIAKLVFTILIFSTPLFAQEPSASEDSTPDTDITTIDLTDPILNPVYLRAAKRDIGDGNQLIIIGVDRSRSLDKDGVVDLTTIGFEGKDVKHVLPYYLFTKNKNEVQEVYSFESGSVKKSKANDTALPPLLLDITTTRKSLLKSSPPAIISGVQSVTNFIPLVSVLVSSFRRLLERPEHSKYLRGVYLTFLIENLLGPGTLGNLEGILTEEDLANVGAVLSLRYHSLGPAAVFLRMSKKQLVEEFRYSIRQKQDLADGSYQKLVFRARQEGLRLVSLSPFSGELLFDCVDQTDLTTYNQYNMDVKKRELAKLIQPECKPGVESVGIGVYSFTQQKKFIQLADFLNRDKARNSQLKLLTEHILEDFLIFSPVNSVIIYFGENALVLGAGKAGSNHYLNNRDSMYAELQAMADTGMLQTQISGQSRVPLITALKKTNKLSAPEKARIEGLLNSQDEEKFNEGFNDLMSLVSQGSKGTRFLGGGDRSRAKAENAAAYNWKRFVNWINTPVQVQGMSAELTARIFLALAADEQAKQKTEIKQEKKDAKAEVKERTNEEILKDAIAAGTCNNVMPKDSHPVILFLVDGLRPDYIRQLAQTNPELVPTIKSLFMDHGLEFDSFNSNSVTLPSWSTILTGYEPDHTTIRGSGTATHVNGAPLQNLLDNRIDAHLVVIPKPTRAYNRMKSLGINWLPELAGRKDTFVSYVPVNDGTPLNLKGFAAHVSSIPNKFFYGTLEPSEQFDEGAGWEGARSFERAPCGHKLAVFWFGGVDNVMHTDNRTFNEAMRSIDRAIKEVVTAASKDPVLKDAVIMMTSDHGMAGGPEVPDFTRPFAPNGKFTIRNTQFNMNEFFSGDEEGISKQKYRFIVGSAKAPNEPYDGGILMTFRRGQFLPYYFTNKGQRITNAGRPGYKKNRTILVEPYGDDITHVFILKDPTKPLLRTTYYELTHFKTSDVIEQTNMPEDLMLESHRKVSDMDSNLVFKKVLTAYNGMRPIGIFTMALQGTAARLSAEGIAGLPAGTLTRDPILVQSKGWNNGNQTTPLKTLSAFILIKDVGDDEFIRYVPLTGFDQKQDSTLVGAISENDADDPLAYGLHSKPGYKDQWATDRQWLELTKNNWYPTALYAIPNLVTLSPKLIESVHGDETLLTTLKSELPDFVVSANDGFTFNSFEYHQGDHGGLSRNQTRTTLFVSHPILQNSSGKIVPKTIMSRDITPTVLDFLGQKEKSAGMQGRSFREIVEKAIKDSK